MNKKKFLVIKKKGKSRKQQEIREERQEILMDVQVYIKISVWTLNFVLSTGLMDLLVLC